MPNPFSSNYFIHFGLFNLKEVLNMTCSAPNDNGISNIGSYIADASSIIQVVNFNPQSLLSPATEHVVMIIFASYINSVNISPYTDFGCCVFFYFFLISESSFILIGIFSLTHNSSFYFPSSSILHLFKIYSSPLDLTS